MMHRFWLTRHLIGLSAVGCLAIGATVATPWLRARTRLPVEGEVSARQALEEARLADAAIWAPDLLRDAEAALRSSLVEQRRQEVRFFLLRDFALARDGFGLAARGAEAATRVARERKSAAREGASAAMSEARRALEDAETLSSSIRLDRTGRTHLHRARTALTEAEFSFESGGFESAARAAAAALRHAHEATGRANRLAARFVDEAQIREWRRWIEDTARGSAKAGGAAIIVYKEKRQLTLYAAGKPVRSYRADMGRNNLNDKLRAGDNATPEGRYRVVARKDTRESRYHRALLLDYPNEADRRHFEAARRSGALPAGARPGGLIEIHGGGGRGEDWTDGCVALSNADMDDLWARVRVGTPVTIVGGDGRAGVFSDALRAVASGARER